MKNKLIWVVFQGASDGNAKTSRNIGRKSKNNEILNFPKKSFFRILFLASPAGRPIRPIDRSADPTDPTDPNQKIPKNPFFDKID